MKKKLLIGVIALFAITALAENHEHNSEGQFAKYQKEQTTENFNNALNELNEKIDKDSTDTNSRIMISYLFMMELDRNNSYFNENIENLDNRTKFGYANLLLEMGKYNESIKVYNLLNAEFPKWSCPWRHKGEAHYKSSQLEEAELATIKSIEVRPDHYDAFVQLAEIQRDLGKKTEALKSIESAVKLMSENTEEDVTDNHVYILYAEILELNNQIEKAEKYRNKVK